MQQFKDLTTKKKIEHILYYYKWHIIIGILIIVFVVNTVQTIIQKDKSVPLLTISLQGFPEDYEEITAWEKEITKKIAKTETEQKVRVDFYPIKLEEQDQASVAYTQKFVVLAAAGEMDIVCLDEDLFMQQARAGYYKALDSLPELDSILGEKESLVVKTITEGESVEHIYGIRVDNLKTFETFGENINGKVIAIVNNTQRLSYSIDFIKSIFGD